MLIIGIVLIVLGVVLFFIRRSQQARLLDIRYTKTTTAKDLTDLAKSVSEGVGKAGAFRQIAELKGIILSETPLISEIAKVPCVSYRATVTREYEEVYSETNPETKQVERKTRRASETISNNTRMVNFLIKDATGIVLVNPKGAAMDHETVVDRFEPSSAGGTGTITFGGFRFSIPATASTGGTLGYRFHEESLPVGRTIYVLGEASDSSGQLMIQKPAEQGRFIISLKSEEELVKAASSSIQWTLYGAVVCGVAGVVLIILGLVR
jgi:uncharacterized membrane protein